MRTWIFLTVLVLALVLLALGGWTARSIGAVGRQLHPRSHRRKETT
jgi:hypothetical protein